MEGPLPQRNGALPPLALLEEGEETRGSAEKVGGRREESRRREEGRKGGSRKEEGKREKRGKIKKEGGREGHRIKGGIWQYPAYNFGHFFILFPTTLTTLENPADMQWPSHSVDRVQKQNTIRYKKRSLLTCAFTFLSSPLHNRTSCGRGVVRAGEFHLGLRGTLGEGTVTDYCVHQGERRDQLLIQHGTVLLRQERNNVVVHRHYSKLLVVTSLSPFLPSPQHILNPMILTPLSPTSVMLTSASTYCRPFCSTEMRAPGGMTVPLMVVWWMWLSKPNVNAECWKPEGWCVGVST